MARINRTRIKRKRRYPTAGKSRLPGQLDWKARYGNPLEWDDENCPDFITP
ncbi:MAG: hypothetical protein V7K41_24010 [Nostoc sp.]|uniref:hypothetical protein n=1 Tax=Nostoc sp. TaxID=1180 RepID=UPI002FF79788